VGGGKKMDAIVSIDEQGRITEFCPASEAIFGYRAQDVIGESLTELLIPERFRKAHDEGFGRYLCRRHWKASGNRAAHQTCLAES
jgi:PAS domain S-box-containing protein